VKPQHAETQFTTAPLQTGSIQSTDGAAKQETSMPTMTDNRRKRIQAKQNKAENTLKREAKIAKKARNSAKAAKTS